MRTSHHSRYLLGSRISPSGKKPRGNAKGLADPKEFVRVTFQEKSRELGLMSNRVEFHPRKIDRECQKFLKGTNEGADICVGHSHCHIEASLTQGPELLTE